ncbi:MAG TPA: PAS domain S-box protein [Ramlibacter sp.]|nr:PAS domain S-box protein [Ramlibacter sp.]
MSGHAPLVPLHGDPDQLQAPARIALATAQAGGPELFTQLVRELSAALGVAMVFVAVAAQDARRTLRTIAVSLDGQARPNFNCPEHGLPRADLPPGAYQFVASGLGPQLEPGSLLAEEAMEAMAVLALNDSTGEPLGLLVAMDRRPMDTADAGHVEAMLRVVAARAAAELERARADETLRSVARAVSASRSGSVFDELVRLLATILQVDVAFIAQREPAQPEGMRVLAMYCNGTVVQDLRYALAGSPCATVFGQRFRAYPAGVQALFPGDSDMRELGTQSYAGHPVAALDGTPLGVVAVASRRPLTRLSHVKATLKIFAVRAAAEVERLRAGEAQKQAVEDLRQREAQYRAIFEGSLDGLFLWDEHLRVVDVNPAGLAIFRLHRDEVIGRSFPRSLPDDYVRDRLDMVRGALAGHTTHVDTTLLRPDLSAFDAELLVMPFVHRSRPHALAAVRDISERRQRERELQSSEAQYRAIFNASIDAMVLRAADFSIVDVNATYEAWTGYSRAEVLGLDRLVANPTEFDATIRALHRKALAGAPVRLETRLLRRHGEPYELELRGVPILHRGQPHVLYIGRDITQAKLAERAQRDSDEQYRAIFNASADALLLRDDAYRAVQVNPAYLAMSGYSREEVMAADRVLTQADPELRRRHRLDHALALAGRELRFEVTATRKDGSELQAEVRGTPVTYRGRPHVLYAVRDISERVAAEHRRAELERQLRQAQKMEAIGQLTGGLAHDFNNILTSVLGYIEMAQERPAAGQDAVLARELGQARLAAERAREHVAQLLAFSRPRRGERRLLTPAQLTTELVQLLRPNLPSSIAIDCGEGSDDAAAVPPVLADPVQFEQVLLNLSLNARDAVGEHGTIRLRYGHAALSGHCASCSTRLDGGRWVFFEVADDGRGMTQDVVDRMFEPFFTTKEVGRGTGMGLAMVHGIVHDHDGHIQVSTAPGQGSSFRVLLPAAEENPVRGSSRAGGASAATVATPLRGRVLLVEDEPAVGCFMEDLMRAWGLDVVLERDPLAAARRLAEPQEAFALLLTDQTMPGMTGLALARHARTQRPQLPVLLYTGNTLDISPEELSGSGVTTLLRKPIDTAQLRPLLGSLLASRERAT